ncbi:Thioredoxin reductase [Clostridiaceae bacterium JG1575]|nr:Thioredoxin reductase [Clostridiaceae bacterium JG1575]
MARQNRKKAEDGIYHIRQRSKKGCWVFRSVMDDAAFLRIVCEAVQRNGGALLAYSLAGPKGYDLILDANGGDISGLMKEINISYSHHRKAKEPIFKDRFVSHLLAQPRGGAPQEDLFCQALDRWMVEAHEEGTPEFTTGPDARCPAPRKKRGRTKQEAQSMLFEWAKGAGVAPLTIPLEKAVRNAAIRYLKAHSTLTLKEIGSLMGLSESSISKILKAPPSKHPTKGTNLMTQVEQSPTLLQTMDQPMDPATHYDCLILGGGPAGLNAALYLVRKGWTVGIFASAVGGQVASTSTVENYLGTRELTGADLTARFEDHVASLNVPMIKYYSVTQVQKDEKGTFEVHCDDGNTYHSTSLILATGSSSRKLGVPGEQELYGRGVTYCAICDGPLYRGQDVVVAGGGNSAVEAALDLSKICNTVTMVHRSVLRADRILIDQLERLPNVTVHLGTDLLSVDGEDGVEGITIRDRQSQSVQSLPTRGVFVEIGYTPNSQLFEGLVARNAQGEILTDENGQTSEPGVFAAGDVTTERYKQIIIAAGAGAKAALALNDWLVTKG